MSQKGRGASQPVSIFLSWSLERTLLKPCNYSISCSYCNIVIGYYFQW